jgi:hypothetical protein
MSRQSKKQHTTEKTRASEGDEEIHDFLVRKLPPGKTKQALYLTNVLIKAGARYDRYAATRNEWLDYAARRDRLNRITDLINELKSGLCELDILSRDDLASRVDQKEIETRVGSLSILSKETTELVEEAQENGRPRDLAEERWILELADIYENAFCQSAGDSPTTFCRFLELSRPTSFPRHGKLNHRQIERALKRRRKRN